MMWILAVGVCFGVAVCVGTCRQVGLGHLTSRVEDCWMMKRTTEYCHK